MVAHPARLRRAESRSSPSTHGRRTTDGAQNRPSRRATQDGVASCRRLPKLADEVAVSVRLLLRGDHHSPRLLVGLPAHADGGADLVATIAGIERFRKLSGSVPTGSRLAMSLPLPRLLPLR